MQLVQSTMWQAIEERLAITTNPRHRAMLEVVIADAQAEADRSVERLMATLVDDPQYHFWVGGRDVGPKGRTAVVAYYEQFVGSGGAVFESPKDRVVVDDHNVVSEAEVRNVVPGSVAKRRGYRVPDETGHYVVWFRNVVFSSSATIRPRLWAKTRTRRSTPTGSNASMTPISRPRIAPTLPS